MKKLLQKLIKDENGYGTVELLILVAAIGVLAAALMRSLETVMVGGEDGEEGAVKAVGDQLKKMIEEWTPED